MSAVKMPEPVGYAVTNKWNPKVGPALQRDASFAIGDNDLIVSRLITTDQAEAYANERVREALEAVESKLKSMQTTALKERVPASEDEGGWNTDCIARAFALSQAILEIRTLAPKDQSTPA